MLNAHVSTSTAIYAKVRPRKNKDSKTYRTLSLARYLRDQGLPFDWSYNNTIALKDVDSGEWPPAWKMNIYITGTLTCYRVRVDYWKAVSGGDFFIREYSQTSGVFLIVELIKDKILPAAYMPK